MPTPRRYPDVVRGQGWTVLPEATQQAVFDFGRALRRDQCGNGLIAGYRQAIAQLPPEATPRAAYDIRNLVWPAALYDYPEPEWRLIQAWRWFDRRPSDRQRLAQHPDLAWLYMLHGDGHVRQAALETLTSPPASPFEFAVVCYRLNDWVRNVRTAAECYAARSFPLTSPGVVGGSALFLLEVEHLLQRWSDAGQSTFRSALARPDVTAALAELLKEARTGRQGYLLQQLLQDPVLDGYLRDLARNALLPSVRRVAMATLLSGRARWLTGYRRDWIDKSMGRSKRVPIHHLRDLTVTSDVADLIAAAGDRSPKVRALAAEMLIERRKEATSKMDGLARRLAEDKSPSVRSRAAFYLKHR